MPAVRIETLFNDRLAHCKHFIKLWSVTGQFLSSHGQASVEVRFSVNKHTEADNFTGDIFEAKHLVCDHTAAVVGMWQCQATMQKYDAYLEE